MVRGILGRLTELNSFRRQAAKGVSDTEGKLVDLFERIEGFFRRLEAYIDIPSNAGMTDTIVKIMVEVLLILGIVTKEMKRNKASES
jgi:hypothetical protein